MTNEPRSRTLDLIHAAQETLDRLTPAQAAKALQEGVIFVDTRTTEEQEAEGVIPGAYRVPRNAIEVFLDPSHRAHFTAEEAAELPPVPKDDEQIIVLCNLGLASSLSAASLHRIGLSGATDVEGGFQAWKAAGLPVESTTTLE
ncbi:sulfurtransferase [Pseudonocardia sulfidoxydans NBRC 16205]|uniref:Sulfurtransferase n=1 Tax=Pseudonocardia sulfidoxydans NBRC 16205 TaxID=1223511 RepID=A0A511DRR1_9PSEU|nr:rhodanese-like domain-containing protein [Pseudonocardia sulfidoxydans]GEL26903.1 sulfurtransferase [Pseudonocardia sulfidoxydans NBRC 16205]